MKMTDLRIPVTLLSAVVLQGLPVVPAYSANNVAVTVTDSSGNPISCGNLVSQSILQNSVTMVTDGTCIGSSSQAGAPTVVAQALSVAEGASGSVDVSQGASVTLPLPANSVTIVAPLPSLGSASRSGSTITYTAPAAGTGTAGQVRSDTIRFQLKDASQLSSAVGTVTVSIPYTDPGNVNPPPPSGCVDTATVVCKSIGNNWPSGTIFDSIIQPGQVHAWAFTYTGTTGGIGWVDGGRKNGSISTIAGDMTGNGRSGLIGENCTLHSISLEGTIRFSPDPGKIGDCGLVTGTTYFMNIQSQSSTVDGYDLGISSN